MRNINLTIKMIGMMSQSNQKLLNNIFLEKKNNKNNQLAHSKLN